MAERPYDDEEEGFNANDGNNPNPNNDTTEGQTILYDSDTEPRFRDDSGMDRMIGRIHIILSSSDEGDSDVDDEGLGSSSRRRTKSKGSKSQNIDLSPNVDVIKKNDITLEIGSKVGLTSDPKLSKKGLPQFLSSRELGMASTSSSFPGFNTSQRNIISDRFLPNSCRKVANYGHKAFVGQYNRTGDMCITAAQDRILRVYDTSKDNFTEIKTFVARDVGWSILDTAISPDGQTIAYSSWSDSIHTHNIYGEGDHQESLFLNPGFRRFCVFSLMFSEDGTELLGGANDGFFYIFDRERNERTLKLEAHKDDINSIAFGDESSHIILTGGDDGLCKVWDRRTLSESDPNPVGIMAGHIDGITHIDSKNDGRYFITNSKDQSIKLWDIRAFSSEDAVTAAQEAVVKQNWDYRWQRVPKELCGPRELIPGDSSVMTYRGHCVLTTLVRCRFSPKFTTSQRYIYTGCGSGRVVIYDLLSGSVVTVLRAHQICVRDVSWHPYKQEIVSTSWDHSVGHWTWVGRHCLNEKEEGIMGIEPEEKKMNLARFRSVMEVGSGKMIQIDVGD